MSKVLIALSARGPVVLKKSKADLSKGLSLFKIMKTTPSIFKSNANNVIVKSLKQTKTRSGKPAIRAVTKDMSKTGRVHHCHFIALDGMKPVYKSKQIFVSCACEAFTFWCEYALTKYGASSIKFSNGEPPVDRNPSELPMICKHLVALAQTCKEHGL